MNGLFVLSFENNVDRTGHTRFFILKVEIKDCNVMINRHDVFDQLVKSNMRCSNIRDVVTGQGDDYFTGYLENYPYFQKHYKMILTDLSKKTSLVVIRKQNNKLILLEI